VPEPTPDWQLTKSANPASLPVGEKVTFIVRFRVPSIYGNVNIASATVVDTFPAGAEILDASGNVVLNGGTIPGSQYDNLPGAVGTVNYTNHTITWQVGPLLANSAHMNCSGGTYCESNWAVGITMRFPSPTFQPGQTVTNYATADVTFADGSSAILNAQASASFVAPKSDPRMNKSGPATVVAGETFKWALQGINYGNTTVTDWTVTDTLPTSGVSGLTLHADYPGDYMPITGIKTVVTFEWFDGTIWKPWFVWNPGDGFPDRPIPAGATKIRATAASLAPGSYLYFQFVATATGAAGDTFKNCAELSDATGPLLPSPTCVTTTVTEPQTQLLVYKSHVFPDAGQSSVQPGDEFTFWVSVKRLSGSPLLAVDFVDLLPAQFEFVATKCIYASPGGATPDSTGPITTRRATRRPRLLRTSLRGLLRAIPRCCSGSMWMRRLCLWSRMGTGCPSPTRCG